MNGTARARLDSFELHMREFVARGDRNTRVSVENGLVVIVFEGLPLEIKQALTVDLYRVLPGLVVEQIRIRRQQLRVRALEEAENEVAEAQRALSALKAELEATEAP